MTGRRARAIAWAVSVLALFGLLFWAYRRFVLAHPDPTLTLEYRGVDYELLEPRMLGAILLAPWFVAVLAKSLADLPWPQRALSVLLRVAFVALLALGLARLSRSATTEKVATVLLVDVSDSVSDESLEDAREAVKQAYASKPDDAVLRVVTFAERPKVLPEGEDAKAPPPLARHAEGEGAGSDLQAALQLAYGLYPPGYLKRAVLFSDGVQTAGDLLAEADRARGFGVRLFTVPYARPAPGEVAVRELRLPDLVKIGETFRVSADVYATRPTRARLRLYQGETLNALGGVREIDLAAGPNDVTFDSVVRVAGAVTYALELEPLGDDEFRENNRFATTIDVPGRPLVLYVDGTPEHAQPLAAALTAQQLDVDVRPPIGMPTSLRELERYDFVILSDAPREGVSLAAEDTLEAYVRDLGGGFLFAGGESGYGLGGWYHTTVERMLPVRMDNEKKKEMPSVAMMLVIDRSGSMNGLPLEMAKAAAKATAGVLSPDDLVGVIAFDSSPTRYVKLQPARNRSRIGGDIARIQSGGGTEIFSALDAAYQDMTVTQARKKHVILLTDGKASTSGIRDLVSAMVAESITVTTVGFGADVDERMLKMIAEVGGGRYHAVTDAQSLPRIFTKETEMIARAAAVEEWFPVTQTGNAAFLRSVDVRTAPNLHGYVSTQLKPAPAEELLASDTGEPILARWRVGLGWTLAWTSDVKSRWAVEWLRWPGFSKLWGQLVHEHMRQKHRRELDMKAEVKDGAVVATVDAFGDGERFENALVSKLTVVGPEPAGKERSVDFRQIAPGRYEARLPLEGHGSFLLRAEHAREQEDGSVKPVATSSGHVTSPYPREYASFEPDRATLERASLAAGGALGPFEPAAVWSAAGERVTYHEELWPRFIYAALGVFLADLLVRRVRIFDRRFLPRRRGRAA
jgi:Mg-chelatase subunit ChlD